MAEMNPLVSALQQFQQPAAMQQGLGQAQKQQQIANLLLGSGQRTNNPIVAALTGYFGTQAGIDAAEQFGNIEQQQMKAEQERLMRQEGRADEAMSLQKQQFEESKKQFQQQMALNARKFNAEMLRDAQSNAIIKIPDEKSGADLLFKGAEPVTDGLGKGMQWAIDKKGNRVAVPIPTQPNERAALMKENTKELVTRLLNNPDGVKDNFGVLDAWTPQIQDETREAATDLKQLRSILTVENLGLMSGVLSESDIKILQAVSGGQLDEGATEEGVTRALKNMYKALGGDPSTTKLGGGKRSSSMSNTATAGGFVFEGFE